MSLGHVCFKWLGLWGQKVQFFPWVKKIHLQVLLDTGSIWVWHLAYCSCVTSNFAKKNATLPSMRTQFIVVPGKPRHTLLLLPCSTVLALKPPNNTYIDLNVVRYLLNSMLSLMFPLTKKAANQLNIVLAYNNGVSTQKDSLFEQSRCQDVPEDPKESTWWVSPEGGTLLILKSSPPCIIQIYTSAPQISNRLTELEIIFNFNCFACCVPPGTKHQHHTWQDFICCRVRFGVVVVQCSVFRGVNQFVIPCSQKKKTLLFLLAVSEQDTHCETFKSFCVCFIMRGAKQNSFVVGVTSFIQLHSLTTEKSAFLRLVCGSTEYCYFSKHYILLFSSSCWSVISPITFSCRVVNTPGLPCCGI